MNQLEEMTDYEKSELTDKDIDNIFIEEQKKERDGNKSINSQSSFCDGEQKDNIEKKEISKAVMKKIELTIAIDYVKDWGLHEALRELFQNAIDQDNSSKNNDTPFSMMKKYYKKHNVFLIGNKNTYLPKKTLILGNSEKAGMINQIGQYGEGYKLALIVLLRNGYKIEIRNGNEIWYPVIKYSKKFETEVLKIFIKKIETKNNDLIFMIKGIENKDFEHYKNYNLTLQKKPKADKTSKGNILLEEKYRGKIFIEGLYVCSMPETEKFWYGYNFNANIIKLDRDRNKLNSFDITWIVDEMFKELDPAEDEKIIKMLEEEAKDAEYFVSKSYTNPEVISRLADKCYLRFKENYGNAFPVENESADKSLKEQYEGIKTKYVPKNIAEICLKSDLYNNDLIHLKKRVYKTPSQILKDFIENNQAYFTPVLLEKFNDEIIKKSVDWSGGSYE